MAGLVRHVTALRSPVLPGAYTRLFLAEAAIGFAAPAHVPLVAPFASPCADGLVLPDPAALADAAAALAAAGVYRPRGEAFDVRAAPDGPVLAQLDRGALPALGVAAEGVHLNGMVRCGDDVALWVGRRAAHKALDPGKLDHLVAGGVPAGLTPAETLCKEADEEAGLSADMVATAQPAGRISYVTERLEGLRRDRLHCFDLDLPESFTPVPRDGEMASFALLPASDVVALLAETDEFKFNVAIVVLDWLVRHRRVTNPAVAQALARLRVP